MNRVAIVAFIYSLMFANTSLGWWGFVHYRVAKEIADVYGSVNPIYAVDPNYAMGPDVYPAYNFFYVITAEFAWSHAVITSDLDLLSPDAPTYPHDGRYPGRIMYDLITRKLRPQTVSGMQGPNAYEQDLMETARGFVVHNAADNIVHWQYFLGGPPPFQCDLACGSPSYMWEINHSRKEEWANYIVLILKDARTNVGHGTNIGLFPGPGFDGVMGTWDDISSSLTEDANGNGILDEGEDYNFNGDLTDYTNDVFAPPGPDGERHLQPYLLAMHQINFKTNAKLMHLAMKVHRKNRRNTDISSTGTESSEFAVKSVADIQGNFTSEILGSAMQELQNMTLSRFLELNAIAGCVNWNSGAACGIPGWYPSGVMLKYDQCVTRGAEWLANIGN